MHGTLIKIVHANYFDRWNYIGLNERESTWNASYSKWTSKILKILRNFVQTKSEKNRMLNVWDCEIITQFYVESTWKNFPKAI